MNKQETLEEYEAAIIKFPEYDQFLERIGFEEGAKWQQEKSYSEEEVRELLETQRGNCYVALLSHTKNDDISSIALQAPEPGGKNGTWVKSI
jgi:hypothetical protein